MLEAWPIAEPTTRRIQIYDVSFGALMGLLQLDGTGRLEVKGIPEGAVLTFIESDNERSRLRLYIQHDSFPETLEGCPFPTAPCITSTLRTTCQRCDQEALE